MNNRMENLYPLMLEAFSKEMSFTFPVHGTSMRPMLKDNDLVTIKKIEGRLHVGDIALYKRENGQFVLHRVRRVHEESYTIVGDHQGNEEVGVLDSQLIGIVIEYQKKGKKKKKSLHSLSYRFYKKLVLSRFLRRVFGRIF